MLRVRLPELAGAWFGSVFLEEGATPGLIAF